MGLRTVHIEELTWPEIQDGIAAGVNSVIIPIGSTEQHGPHLPLGTDSYHTVAVLERVAKRLPAFMAPLLPVGRADHHMGFPGTISIRQETLKAIVHDYCESLSHHGIRNVLVYSGHGGNALPLAAAIAELQPDLADLRIIGCTDWSVYDDTLFRRAADFGINRTTAGGHSGELETSMILALHPNLVHMERAEPGYLGDPAAIRAQLFRDGTRSVTANGILGDPRPGDAARGHEYLDALAGALTAFFVESLSGSPGRSTSQNDDP
jgi:creatinine amidohydrolase